MPPYLLRVVKDLHHLGHGRRFDHLEYHFFMQDILGTEKIKNYFVVISKSPNYSTYILTWLRLVVIELAKLLSNLASSLGRPVCTGDIKKGGLATHPGL
jgi:hypothetical protein